MNPFALPAETTTVDAGLGFEHVNVGHIGTIFARLGVALLLGALLAYRGWRRVLPFKTWGSPLSVETAQAQTLIAVTGALMIAVIGDSMARAFGLVGLGAFIRFRSGIKDPRDAATMFVMIGIGMACGLGNVPMALVAAAFCGSALAVFDVLSRKRMRRTRMVLNLDRPREALSLLREAFPDARVLEMPNAGAEPARIVMDVAVAESDDAASVLAMLEAASLRGVRAVTLDDGKSNGN